MKLPPTHPIQGSPEACSARRTAKVRPLRDRLFRASSALALALCVLLFACSSEVAPRAAPRTAESSAGTGRDFPRVVEAYGTPVRMEARPRRVLPASASAVDLLLALIEPERLVAVPFTAEAYTNAHLSPADWARLPQFRNFQGEDILPHRPDLVVTHGYQRAEATAVLERAGVPVVRLPQMRELADLTGALSMLGELVGEEQRASELIAELEARRAALVADESLAEVRVVTYLDFGTGGWTSGSGTSGDLLIRLAGLRNAATEAGITGNSELDHERLLDVDPDWIIVRSTVAGEDAAPTAGLLRSQPALAGLRAVREDAIVVLPARLFAAESHHVLDAAELLRAEVLRRR